MKVALIGNMNNNNFAIMRYLRDLGLDAYLLLTKEDGVGVLSHFIPENDTNNIQLWKQFIINTNVSIREASIKKNRELKTIISNFDICIGSGLTPAAFYKIDKGLDVFYPYGNGIEYVGSQNIRDGFPGIPFYKKIFRFYLRRNAIKGLYKTKKCLCPEYSITSMTYKELGIHPVNIGIPMYYNKEKVQDILNIGIDKYDLKLICHTRHDLEKDHIKYLKGFKLFLEEQTLHKPILILLNYGRHVDKTKDDIKRLGLEDNVLWLDKMSRKDLGVLIQDIDFGFCEFQNQMWGGTGWEFLAAGVPFFHYFDVSPEEFKNNLKSPIPPFFSTNSPQEICDKLIYYTQNKKELELISQQMKEWFEDFGGIGLAQKWKELIEDIYNSKQLEAAQ